MVGVAPLGRAEAKVYVSQLADCHGHDLLTSELFSEPGTGGSSVFSRIMEGWEEVLVPRKSDE